MDVTRATILLAALVSLSGCKTQSQIPLDPEKLNGMPPGTYEGSSVKSQKRQTPRSYREKSEKIGVFAQTFEGPGPAPNVVGNGNLVGDNNSIGGSGNFSGMRGSHVMQRDERDQHLSTTQPTTNGSWRDSW